MLSRLRPINLLASCAPTCGQSSSHLSIGGRYYDDCAVHVGGTRNHVLNIIGMTWTVDMRIMSLFCLVLDMRCRNGDSTLPFFGCLINSSIFEEIGEALFCLTFCNGSSQGSLNTRSDTGGGVFKEGSWEYFSMINMSNSTCLMLVPGLSDGLTEGIRHTNIYMRFCPLKNGCQSSNAVPIVSKDLLDRIDASLMTKSEPASAQ